MNTSSLKRWPGWALLVMVVAGFLAVGISRDAGPRTPEERVESISKRIACPICEGESVFESRNPSSQAIVEVIQADVGEGHLSDDEIIDKITATNFGKERLVPTASGIEALAWALPAAAAVIGIVGLMLAFRRWQEASRQLGRASDDDFARVAVALHEASAGNAGDADDSGNDES